MGKFFRRNRSRSIKTHVKPFKTVMIQGMAEGAADAVSIENLFTSQRVNLSVPGTTSAFQSYEAQVRETYRKYNGNTDFGNQQTRAVVDLRTAFIAGEGISVSAESDATAMWIENFLDKNHLKGEAFVNVVKGTEMAGQAIMIMKPKIDDHDELFVSVTRVPYVQARPFRAIYFDPILKDELERIEFKVDGFWRVAQLGNFVYVRTGGDDYDSHGPTTKVGILLTDIENYDRALRDMRRNNHVMARITPVFKTTSANETAALKTWLTDMKWRIGQAFLGTAEFSYESPDTGAHDNLKTEMTLEIKTISAVSGVPVHWLGYTDLMSNRSTADSLYEMIKHATISERVALERAMYDLLIKAQVVYIDSGGTDLPALDKNIEVKLPLIDFSAFKERVEALSLAHQDEAISMDDYRGMLPGIDPLRTERAVEKERKEDEERLVKSGVFPINKDTEDDDDGEEDDD